MKIAFRQTAFPVQLSHSRVEMAKKVLLESYMSFFAHKKKALSLSFLVFFVLYAVSPLSASGVGDKAGASPAKTVEAHAQKVRLFLLELFTSVVPQNSEQDENPLTNTILLKKKRMVIRAQSLLKEMPVPDCMVTAHYAAPPALLVSLLDPSLAASMPCDGVCHLCSDRSPPSAQLFLHAVQSIT